MHNSDSLFLAIALIALGFLIYWLRAREHAHMKRLTLVLAVAAASPAAAQTPPQLAGPSSGTPYGTPQEGDCEQAMQPYATDTDHAPTPEAPAYLRATRQGLRR